MIISKRKFEGSLTELRLGLQNTFQRLIGNATNKDWKVFEQALNEICLGIQFCTQNKIDLTVALNPDFSLSGPNNCILAKTHPTGNYFRALETLGISQEKAKSLGFACSPHLISLLSETKLNWNPICVQLWRFTASYFVNLSRL